jgi:pimeloyl-ACP methyl ester carboxylesterase
MFDAPIRAYREIRAALPSPWQQLRFSCGQLRRVTNAYVSPVRMAARIRWNDAHRFGDPSRIDRPVLIITGEDGLDRVVPPEQTRRYMACVPGAQHAVLAGTGHLGLITKPSEFAELVCRFVHEAANDVRKASA